MFRRVVSYMEIANLWELYVAVCNSIVTVLYIPYKAHEYYGCIPRMKQTKSLLGISGVSVSD